MSATERRIGFVLGGGGVHGAAEVGMLQALAATGIKPQLVVGTSIGAINGALVAARPGAAAVDELASLWRELGGSGVLGGSVAGRAWTLLRTRTHVQSLTPLRELLERHLPPTFEQLEVPFQCVAASVERARSVWFGEGALIRAILASCAVPGVFPPVVIDGEHHVDGGLVHSIPVGRAVEMGATEIYVLHVGRIETPLARPRNPIEVALGAFEIGRRHRFIEEIEGLPEGVTAHVLPSAAEGLGFNDPRQIRYQGGKRIPVAIERAREATARYLSEIAAEGT
jgi:NTE family protein